MLISQPPAFAFAFWPLLQDQLIQNCDFARCLLQVTLAFASQLSTQAASGWGVIGETSIGDGLPRLLHNNICEMILLWQAHCERVRQLLMPPSPSHGALGECSVLVSS